MLSAAADETVGEAPEFARQEKGRFGLSMLRALIAANPAYVIMVMTPAGETAGFIVSSPDNGNLLLNWCYLLPRFRKGFLAQRALKAYAALWNYGRFHKIVAYTKSDNTVTHLIMKRLGWREVCRLEKHFFGLDFIMQEHPLTKALPGYETGISANFRQRTALRLRAAFARR